MTLRDLLPSQALGAAAETEIAHVSAIDAAQSDALVFATDPKSLSAAIASGAGAILATAKLESSAVKDPRVTFVEDPRLLFALAAKALQRGKRTAAIHPTAVIGSGVSIGTGCRIGPGVLLAEGVSIGSDCDLDARVTVYPGTKIGDRVHIQAGAVLGSTGFGYARDPQTGGYVLFPQQGTLHIEDDVDIGANTTIDRGALGETRIGAGTKIDNLVHIGHNCIIGRNVIIAAQTGISGSSIVEDGAILGGQVGIGEHATVGPGVILGGGAGVLSGKKMHGPGQVFWGRPARPLKEYLRDLARLRRG